MTEIPKPKTALVCDKCGETVRPENDAVNLAVAAGEITVLQSIFAGARHLLPTDRCEGSPSRAQYLEGQPRDLRSDYPYDPAREERIRKAYQAILRDEG